MREYEAWKRRQRRRDVIFAAVAWLAVIVVACIMLWALTVLALVVLS